MHSGRRNSNAANKYFATSSNKYIIYWVFFIHAEKIWWSVLRKNVITHFDHYEDHWNLFEKWCFVCSLSFYVCEWNIWTSMSAYCQCSVFSAQCSMLGYVGSLSTVLTTTFVSDLQTRIFQRVRNQIGTSKWHFQAGADQFIRCLFFYNACLKVQHEYNT